MQRSQWPLYRTDQFPDQKQNLPTTNGGRLLQSLLNAVHLTGLDVDNNSSPRNEQPGDGVPLQLIRFAHQREINFNSCLARITFWKQKWQQQIATTTTWHSAIPERVTIFISLKLI